jgi:hypothetical protein
MTHSTIDSELDNHICEAAGCFAKATTKIDMKVGKNGIISLQLCNGCVEKFEDHND